MSSYLKWAGLLLGVSCFCAILVACGPSPTALPASPTSTQLPLPTEASTQVATQVPPESPLATPTASATATLPVAEGGPYAVVGVALDDVLNVRSGPGVGNSVVGTIPPFGTGIRSIEGQVQEADGDQWLAIETEDVLGWVNSTNLAAQEGVADAAVSARAAEIILALRDADLERLAATVHPVKGLRFSPYTYVRAEPDSPQGEDLVFGAREVAGLFEDPTIYHWGWFDGTGDPIDLAFADYYDTFVYDVDFSRPEKIGFNVSIGQGNTINNITEVYPDAATVEYHFSGFDPQYAGLDWRSLRLVLEWEGSAWYLVGIVHDEWTI